MSESSIPIGGDFSRIFDHRDFLAMINIPDEATCVLRAHLILEEVLNVWTAKLTRTEDLFRGTFVSFKIKLTISKNIGLRSDLFEIFDSINETRNKFSHRKGHKLESSSIDALRRRVDAAQSHVNLESCDTFKAAVSGKGPSGELVERVYEWGTSDSRIRFVIVFVILMLKVTGWMQSEFITRGIPYQIVANIPVKQGT